MKMKFLYTFVLILILGFNYINCQDEAEREREDVEILPPVYRSPQGETPGTSFTTTLRHNATQIMDKIGESLRNGWRRLKTLLQERYQKTIESLQKQALEAMDRLQSYVDERIAKSSDETTKQYLQNLNSGIKSISDALRNLMTNVESRVGDVREELSKIPEYKIGGQ